MAAKKAVKMAEGTFDMMPSIKADRKAKAKDNPNKITKAKKAPAKLAEATITKQMVARATRALNIKEPKPKPEGTEKGLSAINAAAVILKDGNPRNVRELIKEMEERKLWTSPAGATPWATLYSALMREINEKGHESRFEKTGPGLFILK